MGRVSASERGCERWGKVARKEKAPPKSLFSALSLPLSCSRCLSDHERPIFTNLGGASAIRERAVAVSQRAFGTPLREGGRKTHLSS